MTARVDFYVLARDAVADKYDYACRIANTAFGRGLKVYVQTEDAAQSGLLDKRLWTFSQSSFVPHAIYDGRTCDAERHPVLIGHDPAPDECAELLISLKQEAPADYARFARVAELIIDQPEDKASGRRRFRFYREQGVEPHTHKVA